MNDVFLLVLMLILSKGSKCFFKEYVAFQST